MADGPSREERERFVAQYFRDDSGWAAETGAPIVYYEDFLRSPKSALSNLLGAIGPSEIDRGLVNRAIRNTSFERMRDAEARSTSATASRRPIPRASACGAAGGYADEVSAEDAEFMTRAMTSADLPAWRRYLVRHEARPAAGPA